MNRKKFGFGIVGTGVIAHFHARAIAAIDNAHLVGVYNVNKSKADLFADAHSSKSYESVEELLSNRAIDIVCICTPSGAHLEPALKCIKAGKHCLIEKPLEVTLERCDRLIAAAQQSGVKIGVIFPSRFHEVNRQLKQSIAKGRFGNLVLGDAYVKWNRSPAYYQSAAWRGTWKFDGGGALMNQGIHTVDLLQWLMGPVQSVHAVSANLQHKEIEVEDTIVATLKFANGALGTIECTTAVFPGSDKRIEILGTSGTAVVEENNLLTWQFEQELQEDKLIRDKYNIASGNIAGSGASNPAGIGFLGHQQQIEDMMHAIESDEKPLIDGIEGRKSVQIVLGIYESARNGKTINFS